MQPGPAPIQYIGLGAESFFPRAKRVDADLLIYRCAFFSLSSLPGDRPHSHKIPNRLPSSRSRWLYLLSLPKSIFHHLASLSILSFTEWQPRSIFDGVSCNLSISRSAIIIPNHSSIRIRTRQARPLRRSPLQSSPRKSPSPTGSIIALVSWD